MQSWYVLVQGAAGPAHSGPFPLARMQSMADDGTLLPNSKVARVGAAGWTDAALDPALAAIFPLPAPRSSGPEPTAGEPRSHGHAVDPGRLAVAFAGGLAVAVASAAIWAAISFFTGYQIGYMAVGVGFLVGFSVGLIGQSTSPIFGVMGAALALGGCVLGNLWSACTFGAAQEQVPAVEVCLLVLLDPPLCVEVLAETFSPLDVVFYGIAIYEGFRFAIRPSGGAASA